MLEADNLVAGYTDEDAISDVSFRVRPGEVLTIIGANGAGKTSTLRATVGGLSLRGGRVSVDGVSVSRPDPLSMLRRGAVMVPEGRGIFASLSVYENLQLGGYRIPRRRRAAQTRRVLAMFPRLGERANVSGAVLSGGEQQMLTIARALMSEPRYLLLDEPSMGLAPRIVKEVGQIIRDRAAAGVGVVLVEQNATLALTVADWAIVLERGRVVLEGPPDKIAGSDRLHAAYLGVS